MSDNLDNQVIVDGPSDFKEALSKKLKSDSQLLDLLDNIPVGVIEAGAKGDFITANNTFLTLLGYSNVSELSALNINDDYSFSNSEKVTDLALRNGSVKGFEARWINRLGDPLHVRISLRSVRNGSEVRFDGVVEDISGRKNTEERLRYAMDLEKVSAKVSSHFVNLSVDMIEKGIDFALKLMGQFLGTDRSFVALLSHDRKSLVLTNEWVSADAEHLMWDNGQNTVQDYPWLFDALYHKKTVLLNNISDLPSEAVKEKEQWIAKGIKSRIIDPLLSDGEVIGVVGFDSVHKARRWSDDIISVMKITGEVISNAIKRKNDHEQLTTRVAQETFIASLAKRFVNCRPEDIWIITAESLKEICRFCCSDGAAIICFSEDGESVVHSGVRRDGASMMPKYDNSADAEVRKLPLAVYKELRQGSISSGSITGTGQKQSVLASYLRRINSKAIMLVPVRKREKSVYALEISSCDPGIQWADSTISLLKMVVEIFAAAMELRDSAKELDYEKNIVSSMMDNIPDFINFRDRDSRFIRVNKAFAAAFGNGAPASFIGKRLHDVLPEDVACSIVADDSAVMESRKPIIGKERHLVIPGKPELWLSITLMPLFDEDGAVSGTYCISRNITVQKKAEIEDKKSIERSHHIQKLESLGVMCSGIAHDFNNFLMGILGNLSLALIDTKPEAAAWPCIKQAETMALRAAELTGQLLIYSGKSLSSKQTINVSTLVKEMSHLLKVSIPRRIKLVTKYNDDIPPVECDPSQIRQVVMNIIINASQAIGDNTGTITMSTDVVHCDEAYLYDCYATEEKVEGDYILVEISDTGCGMTTEVKERLFDPFFTTKEKGHGLGLSAVLGVLKAHNGAMKLYSEPDKGTTFKILLPALKGSAARKIVEPDIVKVKKQGAVIAVVDDDDVVSKVIISILDKGSCKTRLFHDGQSFLKFVRQNKAKDAMDAVLLDMTLPDIQGNKVLASFRRTNKKTPVVLISGYAENAVTAGINKKSFQGYMQKPFSAAKLLGIINEVL